MIRTMSIQTKYDPLIVGITGATGAALGVETLRACRDLDVEAHLIITETGVRALNLETDLSLDDIKALATKTYPNKDVVPQWRADRLRRQA